MTELQLPEEVIFLRALEIESAAARALFVKQACGNDALLRAGVEALLQASEKSGDLLDVSRMPVVNNADVNSAFKSSS